MTKKRKRKSSVRSQDRSTGKSKGQRKNLFLLIGGVIVIAVILVVLYGRIPFTSQEEKKGKSFTVQGGEPRPVLDPFQFTGMVRAAYAAAEKYPEVMDEVFCYCTCDQSPFHHKSLLSCWMDKHGAG